MSFFGIKIQVEIFIFEAVFLGVLWIKKFLLLEPVAKSDLNSP